MNMFSHSSKLTGTFLMDHQNEEKIISYLEVLFMDFTEANVCSLPKEERDEIYSTEKIPVKSIIFVSYLKKLIFFHINDTGTFWIALINLETKKVISKNCSTNLFFESFPRQLRSNLLNFFSEKEELDSAILKEWDISKKYYDKILSEHNLSLGRKNLQQAPKEMVA